jgi:hypothetical protein
VQELQIKLPKGVLRAVSFIRTALPMVQRVLPLFQGNFSASLSELLTPQAPETPVPAPAPLADLTPIQASLDDLKVQQHDLSGMIFEHGASIKRVDDRLELVRESTDRNTLEQQELIEELKDVGKKVNLVTLVALGLLGIAVVLNTLLYLHIARVLR